MPNIPTPHIEAKEGEIAKSILLPGDPKRAKFIADNFLTDVHQFNQVRNMLGFTGKYKGKEVSVMGTGMGMPSIGIYSYELMNFYGVNRLIRVGTAGAMQDFLNIGDIVIAQGACSSSSMPTFITLLGSYAPICSSMLLLNASRAAFDKNVPVYIGNVLSSDFFYSPNSDGHDGIAWKDLGVLAVEMESAMLYLNAAMYHKDAISLLTISDSLITGEVTDSKTRETAFTEMMEIALEIA